jgi:HIV Tat-specific factor 1
MTKEVSYSCTVSHCVFSSPGQKMNNRFFAGRQVIAHLLEGKPRFKRSGRGGEGDDGADDDDDEASETQRRQDAFGEWLDAGGDA